MTHCSPIKAKVSDLFVSVQGEGTFVGVRQVFVRLSGCNLNCNGCDTDYSFRFTADWKDILDFIEQNNPIHSVAITGGEPLLQYQFLSQFLPRLKDRGYKVYLETNATLPDAYSLVANWIDVVSADVKIPSVWNIGEQWDVHRRFLTQVSLKSMLIAKVVLSSKVQEEDFEPLVDLLFSIRRDMIVVLQPMWPVDELCLKICMLWQERLMRVLDKEVRVVPQVHKFLGVK